jgi:regulator of sigma E protease
MTLLAFLLALGVLITVHEWGHYRVAVACGVKVLTFSIGFGKPWLRWKSRKPYAGQDTEFCISLIPLGGYVRMLDEREVEVTPQDVAMAFNRQPLWARAAIVSAGPLANLLLAVCLYAATFWLGQYEIQATLAAPVTGSVADRAGLRSGDTVVRAGSSKVPSLDALRWWVPQQDDRPVYLEVQPQGKQTSYVLRLAELPEAAISNDNDLWQARGLTHAWSRAVLGDVQVGMPAHAAGLQRGDEVLRVDGAIVMDGPALRAMVRRSGQAQAPESQVWDISRDGRQLQIEVTPQRMAEGSHYVGRIGAQVGEPPAKVWVQYGLFDGLRQALAQTTEVIAMTLDMLHRLLTGHAALDNLSGPITLADYAGRSASLGLGAYLSYLALVSINLGVFNLLPLPMLDGGHLLYYLYEACTGRPPSPEWLDVMQRVGFAMLVSLMTFSLFNDVVRLGWFP